MDRHKREWVRSTRTYSLPAHSSSSCGSKAKVVTGVEGALGEGPGRGILAAYSNTVPGSAPILSSGVGCRAWYGMGVLG